MTGQQISGAGDEVHTGALLMPLSALQPYEHNPRQGSNTEYQRIKASIRSQGLDQPLVVTRRPGEMFYVPLVGGNTRLKILQELYQETEEERFGTVSCVYRPWTEESHVLLAHLRENELRGSLIFIDRALAVLSLKALLESELPEGDITLRRLARIMTHRGLSISHGMISKMMYAVERLLPLMPQALNAGLGRPQLEKIHALDNAFLALWQRHALGPDTECADTFAALCRRYDSPDWNLQLLRTALENEITEAAEVSLQSVRILLEGLLSGRGAREVDPEPPEAAPRATPTAEARQETPPAPKPVSSPKPVPAQPVAAQPVAAQPVAQDTPVPSKDDDPLVALRERAFTLASRLAQHYGLTQLIVPLPEHGLGFMLTDIPSRELRDTLDPALLNEVACVWWHLAACADLTAAPMEQVAPHLESDSVLQTAVLQRDASGVLAALVTPDPGQWGAQLWRALSGPDWRDLLELMSTYRAIHDTADRTGTAVWPQQEIDDADEQRV